MLGRILVAIVGVPLLIVILLFCPPVCLPVAFGALCGIGACELLQSTGAVKNKRAAFYSVVFSVGVPFWYYFGCQMIWAVGAMFLLMLLLFGEAIASKQRMKAEEIALCGVVTNICVVSNAVVLHSAFLSSTITVLKDLCGTGDNAMGQKALDLLTGMGYNVI